MWLCSSSLFRICVLGTTCGACSQIASPVDSSRVEQLRGVPGRSRRRALEEHVLDEVRDPAAVSRLVPRSPRQPDANADGTDLRQPLGQNTKAVIENISDDE